jgi:formylmethanofuran dehydrogenase subunit E
MEGYDAYAEAQGHADDVRAVLNQTGGVVRCDRCGKYTAVCDADIHDNDEILCHRCVS